MSATGGVGAQASRLLGNEGDAGNGAAVGVTLTETARDWTWTMTGDAGDAQQAERLRSDAALGLPRLPQ